MDDNEESAQDNAAIEDGRDTEASEVKKHEILTKVSDDNLSGGSQEEVNNMIGEAVLVDPVYHTLGDLNIADIATRGKADTKDVAYGSTGWTGPNYLKENREIWPVSRESRKTPQSRKPNFQTGAKLNSGYNLMSSNKKIRESKPIQIPTFSSSQPVPEISEPGNPKCPRNRDSCPQIKEIHETVPTETQLQFCYELTRAGTGIENSRLLEMSRIKHHAIIRNQLRGRS